MDIFYAIILGVIQGLTEFLPISSSGHLVIFQKLFGFKEPELLFDCAVHIGTLIAVFVYFFNDIKKITVTLLSMDFKNPNFSFAIDIITGSIPTAIIGFAFKDAFEKAFNSAFTTGIMLCITGIFLGITKFVPKGRKKRAGFLNSLLIGSAQGIAIIPGISRSGATIVCGLICGLEREIAARFSFLLSIPAIIGAFFFEIAKINEIHNITSLVIGVMSSAIVGILALKTLITMIKKGKLFYFSIYCLLLGIITVIICL